MELAEFEAKIARLDRDIAHLNHILQEAHQRERTEIRLQLLAVLQEKNETILRQAELGNSQITPSDLQRMARALAAFSALRNILSNEKNWGLVSNIFFRQSTD